MGLSDHYQVPVIDPSFTYEVANGLCCQHFEIHMASDSGHPIWSVCL